MKSEDTLKIFLLKRAGVEGPSLQYSKLTASSVQPRAVSRQRAVAGRAPKAQPLRRLPGRAVIRFFINDGCREVQHYLK